MAGRLETRVARRVSTWAVRHGKGDRRQVYVGDERRQSLPDMAVPGLLVVSVVACILGAIAVGVWHDGSADDDSVVRHTVVTCAAAVLTLVAAASTLARFGLTRRATDAWFGVGFLALGGVEALALLALLSGGTPATTGIQSAMTLCAPLFMLRASFDPVIDTRLTTARAVALGTVAVIAVWLLGTLAPAPIAALLHPEGARLGGTAPVVLGAAWCAAGLAAALRVHRRPRPLAPWHALILGSAAVAHAMPLLGGANRTAEEMARSALGACAGTVAIIAGLGVLCMWYREQARAALHGHVVAAARATELAAERARLAERDHDLRSGLLAIEAVMALVEMHHDRDDGSPMRLATAASAEAARLKRMLGATLDARQPLVFGVREVVAPLTLLERATGLDLDVDIPESVRATGSAELTVRVVRILLDNARQHAGGSVRLRASSLDGRVQIVVEDDGPGVAITASSDVAGRVHQVAHQLHGLGLLSAHRLMAAQGGTLRMEAATHGGARLVVELPAAPSAQLLPPDPHEGGERVDDLAEPGVGDTAVVGCLATEFVGRRHTDDHVGRHRRRQPHVAHRHVEVGVGAARTALTDVHHRTARGRSQRNREDVGEQRRDHAHGDTERVGDVRHADILSPREGARHGHN